MCNLDNTPQERLARNEAFFRDVNERINDAGDRLPAGEKYTFFCECSDANCTERIELSRDEYEHIRTNSRRFVLARGHIAPEIEHVVEQETDHVVVEKHGEAGLLAVKLDPRTA